MTRQRETERDRLGPLIEQIEQGQEVDIPRILALQSLDVAQASRDAMLDATENERARNEQYAADIRAILGE